MDLRMQYVSFFVIQTEDGGSADSSGKRFKHYQTMDGEDYNDSELRKFLDEEFKRIIKRKAERNPSSAGVPTRIGRFEVEPGYELGSNQNYNLFERLRTADTAERYHSIADELVRIYMDTSAVRGGALIVARASAPAFFDETFLFVLKCDFDNGIVRIADERQLISQVEMAISAKGIKSIQYPHMPEEGMPEYWELKIHQPSHARYFEDFLRYVTYDKPLPEVVSEQVVEMVQHFVEQQFPDEQATERAEMDNAVEMWAASEKRQLQQWWPQEQVEEAAAALIEQKPDLGFSCKISGVAIKGLLADFGRSIQIAKHNGKFVLVVEGVDILFEKGMSPVELLQPQELTDLLPIIGTWEEEDQEDVGSDAPSYKADTEAQAAVTLEKDDVPW